MMSTDILTGVPYLDYDDYNQGRIAITYYHNAMVRLYPNNYKFTLKELIDFLRARGKPVLEQIGNGIITTEATDKTVRNAMEYLAQKGRGKIPSSNNSFIMAISDQLQADVSFTDISSFVALETAKDIVNGVAVAGQKTIDLGEGVVDSAISIAKNLKWILPVVAIGGAFIYVYLMPKRG